MACQPTALLASQLQAGEWYAPGTKSRKQATQYFEVVGYLTNRCVAMYQMSSSLTRTCSTYICRVLIALAHQGLFRHWCLSRWIGYATLVITIIGLLSTGIAQVIACRYLCVFMQHATCLHSSASDEDGIACVLAVAHDEGQTKSASRLS
jgi:hypothetical protein